MDQGPPVLRNATVPILTRFVLLVAGLLAGLTGIGGCADAPELGNGANVYTINYSPNRLRIFEVDRELSKQAQAGTLDLNNLPPGRLSFPEVRLDPDGNEVTIPWVVSADMFFTQLDIYFAEASPVADGSYQVFYQLNDGGGRDNSSKMQRLTAAMAAEAGATGEQASLAIVFNDTVRAVLPVTTPIVDGAIKVSGLSQEEAEEMVSYFLSRDDL